MAEKPLETPFLVSVSSESKVAERGLVLKLKNIRDEEWQGGLFEPGGATPVVPFVLDSAKPDATSIEYRIADGSGGFERFRLTLRDDQIKKGGRLLAISQSLGGDPTGPFEETDIWVAEEEDPAGGYRRRLLIGGCRSGRGFASLDSPSRSDARPPYQVHGRGPCHLAFLREPPWTNRRSVRTRTRPGRSEG